MHPDSLSLSGSTSPPATTLCAPIPIISLPSTKLAAPPASPLTPRSRPTPSSSLSVSAPSSSQQPAQQPYAVTPAMTITAMDMEDHPPPVWNEPALLERGTGQLRRMRSVLDMRLGAMALSLDAHLSHHGALIPRLEESSSSSSSSLSPLSSSCSSSSGAVSVVDAHTPPSEKRKCVSASPMSPAGMEEEECTGRNDKKSVNGADRRRGNVRRTRPDALFDTNVIRNVQEVDIFGISIPDSSRNGAAVNGKDGDWDGRLSPSSFGDGCCSLVLADSPSSLDLSALLC